MFGQLKVIPHTVRQPIPPMLNSYKAQNRNVAVILFREWAKAQ